MLGTEPFPGMATPDELRLSAALREWVDEASRPATLGELTRRLRALRTELRRRVRGQEHAIQRFVDGLFNTEVIAAADADRRKPCGLFVFAGPPGVGKTYLAEVGASYLDRPFKRFDMSAFAHGHETVGLVGTPRMYQGAQPGALTEFVHQHPNAVLLFDEIEKAHQATIQLFLQLLDAGRLQDKFTEEVVEFRDAIVIFTTNVGRSLYENENASGVHRANAAFHRRTVLDALRSDVDPRTREPFFPAAICSRLATGYPILFNHLRVGDLAAIAQAELERVGALLERRHGQRWILGDEVALAIVMREGAETDARTVKAQAEGFLKDEVFKACQLFADERVDAALGRVTEIPVELDDAHAGEVAARLFRDRARPSVLLVADPTLARVYANSMPEIDWALAATGEQAFDVLARRAVDFVLLDLALPEPQVVRYADPAAAFHDVSLDPVMGKTFVAFDHSPLSARRFAAGQRLLEQLHARAPETPVLLLALDPAGTGRGLDEELLLACVRAGGARGAIHTGLVASENAGLEAARDALRSELEGTARRFRQERMAAELGRQLQVIAFDTAPALDEARGRLQIRLRNFRLVRALRSADTGAVVSDVERPATRFADVIGATGAKEALGFVRDWLRDPKRYAAAGVEPPRGVLLTGPPGTGKTMLARALAGESECAFLVAAATNFVTMWQGSGPQNIRDLFARARRYAPSIVFIDELDAVGKTRSASPGGAGRAQEETLNALLTEIDGFAKGGAPVIMLAATNHAELLDPALRRRFSREIEVELPTRAERALYLTTRLAAKERHEVTPTMIERIAVQTAGLSIALLESVLNQAAVMAFDHDGVITDPLLSEAFEKVTMGEAKPGADPERTARHEAGHALLQCLTGAPPVYVTIVGRGNFGGYTAMEDQDQRRSQTRPELEDRICVALGGRQGEQLFYGPGAGESTGPSRDLQDATRVAEAMVYELGMSDEVGFVHVDRDRPLGGALAERCHAAVRRIIEEQSERAARLLAEHRASLERIAVALRESDRLLRDELLALLAPDERARAERAV
ncbi:MAG: AAA family ATPase [Deltaproteobacteria bacterium]|nr:AAA family ATPase [Deltaproteobacteria bacterium]